ncbi:DNA helicase UvrD [Pantoea agglomerans]|uniref:DNA helicase UvrD n=1 Tax=Enterobacter agglomerans TaxID=549 RepID=UPI00320B7B3E
MDKRVDFAVAGSGKTTLLTEHLSEYSRALILTHIRNNEAHLRARLIQRFDFLPDGIRIMTWFEFLHGFCFRQLLQQHLQSRGLSFVQPQPGTARVQRLHFQDGNGRHYHRLLSLLLMHRNVIPDIRARLGRYYDALLVDDVQDFAGHDFNFLFGLCSAEVSLLLAGDFYQHSFDTSRDGNTNSTLHDDITRYESRFLASGVVPDRLTLSKTWRSSPSVCSSISEYPSIRIESHRKDETLIELITCQNAAAGLHADDEVIKLFYQEHHRYGCHSLNWGASSGLDHFTDVCIVLGAKHWTLLTARRLNELPPAIRNKLCVACSRARGRIWFLPERLLSQFRQ